MREDGEEWKGEPDPEELRGKGIFHDIFFGRGIVDETEEQKAARLKIEAENRAKGELHYLTMIRVKVDEYCVKCGHNKVSMVLAKPGSIASYCAHHAGHIEHLHVNCKRCGYCWCRKTLDAQ